jgi:SWI/SNF-related matrix-associated actin-dependent regulator 1 of chromatin subfamily A
VKLYKNNQYYIIETEAKKREVASMISLRAMVLSTSASNKEKSVIFSDNPYSVADIENDIEDLQPLTKAIASSQALGGTGTCKLPAGKALWPYQNAALDYVLERKGGLIASDMGLGKTPMAIAFCNEVEATRILVIVPAALRLQWAERIAEWATLPALKIATMMHTKNGIHPTAHYQIISYQAATNPAIIAALSKYQWDVLILDEVHNCKSIDAIRTRAIFGNGKGMFVHGKIKVPAISTYCKMKLGLTGTPILNRPSEAYTLLRFFDHEAIDFISYETFKQKYNQQALMRSPSGRRFSLESTSREQELQNRLRVHIMARHLKRDVMPQMQLPRYSVVRCENNGVVTTALEAESLLNLDIDKIESGAKDADVLGHIAEVRRIMGEALAPQIAEYAKVFLEGSTEKLVIFAWHVKVLDILQDALKLFGVERIDGSKSALTRKKSIDNFINSDSVRVLIGNMQSIGTGLDGLQNVCSHCFIAEPDWVPAQNEQAVSRLDRIGQKELVNVEIFVAPGSISEKILVRALKKINTIDKILNRKGKNHD